MFVKQGGRCFYCHEQMIIVHRRNVQMSRQPRDPRECTIEHLVDRTHPQRGLIPGRLVAACHQCNQERGRMAEQGRGLTWLQKQSGYARTELERVKQEGR